MCFFTFIFCISLQSQPSNQNHDWNNYPVWENTTHYSKTYVVNQRHPEASDNNPGTNDKPFLTINKSAQIVKAGERVLIRAGIYRETVEPLNEGTGPEKMISYEAAPGEKVIVSGSRILKSNWIQRRVLTDILPDSTLTYTWSRKIWVTTLPEELFDNEYFPFKLPNILPDEFQLMPWAKLVKKLAPYISTRGMIFQNGKRMIQLEDYNDLARIEGTFWVDGDGKTIHIHAFGSGNANNYLFEIGVKSHLFRPQKIGLGYIQIQGITFEHCANGFLRTSTGAVTAMGGHHWIVENNIIRNINSSGLEFGYYAYEFKDPNPRNIQPRTDQDLGGIIVRNNQIFDCGTAAIRSYSVRDGIIENNHIWNCGWHDAENYWEVAGIKILRARNTLVKGNHIHNIQGGNGIWLDWDIQNSRVTANVIHDIQNIQGGIFIEAAQVPNMVDNNLIWNIDGNGIYANDTDELTICHNLISNTSGPVVNAVVSTQRILNERWLTANRNKILNNLFIDGGQPITLSGEDNLVDFNLYVSTTEPNQIDLKTIQENGDEKNSLFIRAFAEFSGSVMFNWMSESEVMKVPTLSYLNTCFFNAKRDEKLTNPGPFLKMDKKFSFLLNEIQAGK